MANTDNPSGLRPVGHLLGLDWSEKITWYFHPATDNVAIGLYDLVTPISTGAEATGEYPLCEQADATDALLAGVAVAFRTDAPGAHKTSLAGSDSSSRLEYCPASTACYIGVLTDPYVIYLVQEDSVGANLAAADVGLNIDVTVAAASATTGLSQMEIDSNGGSGPITGTAQLRILGLADPMLCPNNTNAIGANAKWLVLINEHVFKGTVGL
jgi:hypothetical protein